MLATAGPTRTFDVAPDQVIVSTSSGEGSWAVVHDDQIWVCWEPVNTSIRENPADSCWQFIDFATQASLAEPVDDELEFESSCDTDGRLVRIAFDFDGALIVQFDGGEDAFGDEFGEDTGFLRVLRDGSIECVNGEQLRGVAFGAPSCLEFPFGVIFDDRGWPRWRLVRCDDDEYRPRPMKFWQRASGPEISVQLGWSEQTLRVWQQKAPNFGQKRHDRSWDLWISFAWAI